MDKMPEFKPSSLDQRVARALATKKPLHHSITDWDFQNVSWLLDEAVYKAAPPSLHGAASGVALAKHATTGALSDGRLVFWARSSGTGYLARFWFRNQHADGGADYVSTYYVAIKTNDAEFRKWVATAPTLLDTHVMTWTWAADTWYKVRVTWWSSAETLWVRVERWTGSAWVTLGGAADTDFSDADDLWKDNAVNRTGSYYTVSEYIDDLEVWG